MNTLNYRVVLIPTAPPRVALCQRNRKHSVTVEWILVNVPLPIIWLNWAHRYLDLPHLDYTYDCREHRNGSCRRGSRRLVRGRRQCGWHWTHSVKAQWSPEEPGGLFPGHALTLDFVLPFLTIWFSKFSIGAIFHFTTEQGPEMCIFSYKRKSYL